MTKPAETPNVMLARAIGEAIGVTSMRHCAGMRLELAPGQLPKVVAEFWLRSPEGLVRTLGEYTLMLKGEPSGAPEVPELEEARDAA